MSLYILDTDHVTLHQRNHPQVIAGVQRVALEELATTIITVEEQMRGRLAQLRQHKANLPLIYDQLRTTVDYFCDLKIIPFKDHQNLSPISLLRRSSAPPSTPTQFAHSEGYRHFLGRPAREDQLWHR